MRKIRILIVDDSVVVRRLVSDVLSSDPGLEVAGIAANGKIALAKIPQVKPDIITLDVEMPEMDGLETLRRIRKEYINLPVIMFSSLTRRGATATLDALSLGANDYVIKPTQTNNRAAAMKGIFLALVPKIKAFCSKIWEKEQERMISPTAPPSPPETPSISISVVDKPEPAVVAPTPSAPLRRGKKVDVVVVGVSTGGPNALTRILPVFPKDFPAPILIVQHMPPLFTKLLADRLNTVCALTIRECVPGQPLEPGCAWVAPGNFHMIVRESRGSLALYTHQGPPENSCRPSVDVLFRSAANVFGDRTLGVVLTGMGQDGYKGSELIHKARGQVLVQDQSSSVVWGMPGYVAKAGLADGVYPLDDLGNEIIRRVTNKSVTPANPSGNS